jgi:hypothetical protein
MSITLKKLAYFNRTFFPEDLVNGLRKHGDFSDFEIHQFVDFLKQNRKGGIIQLYQEYISDKYLVEVLEKIFQDHLTKID